MVLFKKYHIFPMYVGIKTVTRRFWKYPHVKIGNIYPVTHKMFYDPEDIVGYIIITSIDKFPLGMMTEEDAYNEGGYTLAMYKKTLESITKKPWDPYAAPYVVKFRFTLADTIDPNGGTEMREEYKRMYDEHMREV